MVHILGMMRWSMEAASNGVYPSTRHDGCAFKAIGDEEREANARLAMQCKFVLLNFKGDWAEYVSTLGFTGWSARRNCCLWCDCTKATMFRTGGFNPGEFPHTLTSSETWEAACRACELDVQFATQHDLDSVSRALYFDRRSRGGRVDASAGLFLPSGCAQGIGWNQHCNCKTSRSSSNSFCLATSCSGAKPTNVECVGEIRSSTPL